LKFGRSVTLSGKLTGPQRGNKTVMLREDPFPFLEFEDVDATSTNSQGDSVFTRVPGVNTRYQTRRGGEESRIVTVNVRPRFRCG
jgi:hypothetical protein